MKRNFTKLSFILTFIVMANQLMYGQCSGGTGPHCYSLINTLELIQVDICPDPGMVMQITWTDGQVEDAYDELEVYSGGAGTGSGGTSVYNGYGTGGDLSGLVLEGNAADDCLHIYIDSDGSNTCSSSGYTAMNYTFACVSPPPPPVNDDCGGAYSVTVNPDLACGSVTFGTVDDATASPEDASACGGTEDDDVWFSFMATGTSHKIEILNASGSNTDMYHSVWEGSCGSLALVAGTCSDSDVQTVNGLTAGNTYYIRVYTYTATGGQNTTFDVCVGTPAAPPVNDDCGGAYSVTVNADLTCGSLTSGTVESATASPEDASACGGTEDDDVWFSFMATGTSHEIKILNASGSVTDMYHSVWEGSCGSLALVAGTCSDSDAQTVSTLTAGNTYYIRVYTWTATGDQNTTFDVCVGTPPAPPMNDDCAGAIDYDTEFGAIGANGTCPGNTSSLDISDYTDSGTDPTCDFGDDATAWYTWVANAESIDFTSGVGDPGIEVLSGSCGSFSSVACLNNASGTINGLTIGDTYYFIIYDDGLVGTTIEWCLEASPIPPLNDDCANAEALTLGTDACGVTTAGTTENATSSGLSPGCGMYNGFDVWYSFVAPATGDVTITTLSGVVTDGAMAVYDACGGALVECDDDDGPGTMPELILSGLTSGATYYIAFWEYNGDNNGTFEICAYERTCTPATFSAVNANNNCPVEEFFIDVDVTNLGSAATVNITDGITTFHTGVGLGTHSIGPYGVSTTVAVRVEDNMNAACFDEMNVTTPGACPPGNDLCVNAEALTLGDASCSGTTNGTTENATNSGLAPGCGSYNGFEVWYSFVAPASGNVTIETTAGVVTDGAMAVYGSCGSGAIECDDDDGLGSMPLLELTGLTSGATYYIAFWEYGGNNNGTFEICAYETCYPPIFTLAAGTNNCPAVEFFIDVDVTDLGGASGVNISDGTTVFFTNVGIGTYSIGSFFDNTLVTVTVEDNVRSTCFDQMDFTTGFCPPGNNDCVNSIDLSGVSDGHSESGTTIGATSSNPGTCGTSLDEPGVWYRFDANGDQDVTFETCSATFDTKIGIFTGSCGTFTCETGNDDYDGVFCTSGTNSTRSAATLTVSGTLTQTQNKRAPQSYYIYVAGFSGQTGDFDLGVHTGDAAALPLEWGSIQATSTEDGSMVEWKTLSEINVSHFELFRSVDGLNNWEKIYQVKATNTIEEAVYNYQDPMMHSTAFYKVMSIDLDGTKSYSDIVSVNRKIDDAVNLIAYPSPVYNDQVNLMWNSSSAQALEVVVTDVTGRVMLTQNLTSINGTNNYQLDLNGMKHGIYNLRLLDNKETIGFQNIVVR